MVSAQDQIGLIMQLRRRGIRDNNVLRAIERVPRDLFVDPEWADYAYRDEPLPIACGQTISQPYVVAFMTERLELDDRPRCWRSARARATRPPCCRISAAGSTPSSAGASCRRRPSAA